MSSPSPPAGNPGSAPALLEQQSEREPALASHSPLDKQSLNLLAKELPSTTHPSPTHQTAPAPPDIQSAQQGALNQQPPPAHQHPPTNPSVLSTAGDLFDRIDPQVSSQVREVGWSILERFARVTQVSRDTASRFLNHPLTQPLLPILPRDVQRMSSTYRPEEHAGPVLDEILREFPAASMYLSQWLHTRVLGHPNPQGLGTATDPDTALVCWEEDEDEESAMGTFGVLSNKSSMPKPATKRSPKHSLTAADWIKYTSTSFKSKISQDLDSHDSQDTDDDITAVIFEIKTRIFLGGIEHDIRPQVWKFLLGYLPWGSTLSEQDRIVEDKTTHYNRLKTHWCAYSSETMTPDQWDTWSDWRHRIAKDVIRTDRHHGFYASDPTTTTEGSSPIPSNLDEEEMLMSVPVASEEMCTSIQMNVNLLRLANVLSTYVHYQEEIGRTDFGYVQGMSDLCAVLLLLQSGSEVDTFWCFVGLMERLHPNFHENQVAMHHQLTTLKSLVQFLDFRLFRHLAQCDALNMFFAFRWLLIWFKREFSIPDVIQIWETSLTDVRSPEYVLFVALAMIEHVRTEIISQCTRFDQILKLINESAENMPAERILESADVMFQVFENKLMTCQRAIAADASVPGSFPDQPANLILISELDKVLYGHLQFLSVTHHHDA